MKRVLNKTYIFKQLLKSLIVVLILSSVSEAYAQKAVLKGVVKDAYSNEPLPFVNMIIYNTQTGTATDMDGSFTIEVEDLDFVQLKLSSLGFREKVTEEIYLSGFRTTFIEIFMEPISKSLQEIVIKPSAFVNKKENPVSLRRIGVDQIEKSAGANRDISKVIQSFPGVASTASFRNDILVRGGGPAENKFYIDGIEIPTINHFSTQGSSGGPVGILNVDFIREVDFYSGAFPASRGNALSSVLEFKQVDGNREDTDIRAVLGASEVALSASAPLSEKTTVLASVRRSYLQLIFKALDLPFLPTFTDFQFKTRTRINKKNEITFLGFGAIDDFELNTDAGDTPENQYILSFIPVNNQRSYTIGTNFKHYFEKSFMTFVLSRNYLNNTATKYRDNIERPENLIYDYASDEIENKFRTEYSLKRDRMSINAGISLETGYYDNSTFRKEVINNVVFDEVYNSDLSIFKYGLFASVTQTYVGDRLGVTVGVRSDANTYSSSMNNLLDQISPRVSVSYKYRPEHSFTLSYGQYYQLPAYTTLGFRNDQGVLVNKNNQLKYISSDQYIVGWDYMPNDFTKFTIEGFYKGYSNYPFSLKDSISLASKGGDFGVVGDEAVRPQGEGRAYGFEVMARQKSSKGYNFIASYTFVTSEFKDYFGKYIPSSWDSKHIITATFNKKMKKNWDVGFKWRFLGGLPFTPVDEDKTTLKQAWDSRGREFFDFSRFNQLRMNSFHQLDVRVDKQYLFKNWALGFYLDIQNLYNYKLKDPARYVLDYDNQGQPIIINPEAPVEEQRYSFTKIFTESGTVLPTVGIKIEF